MLNIFKILFLYYIYWIVSFFENFWILVWIFMIASLCILYIFFWTLYFLWISNKYRIFIWFRFSFWPEYLIDSVVDFHQEAYYIWMPLSVTLLAIDIPWLIQWLSYWQTKQNRIQGKKHYKDKSGTFHTDKRNNLPRRCDNWESECFQHHSLKIYKAKSKRVTERILQVHKDIFSICIIKYG